MKICYLANGQSIHTQKWAKYFVDRGHDVHLVTFSQPDHIQGVKVHGLEYSSRYAYFSRMRRVKKAVRDVSPDVLHAHYVTHYGIYGALSGFRPLVVTAWGSDILIEPEKSMIKKHFVRHVLSKADSVTCDATHMREAMIRLGAAAEKIAIINFGVDTQKFSPKTGNEELRAKLGIRNLPTVVSLRNLEPLYNVESLIRSIPLVLKVIPEAKFVIVGTGSEEDRLKELVKSLGVSECTRFIGFISNDVLPEYLNSVDVYVSTALSDAGLSAATAEAMACGLPVVVTDVAANRDWVRDEMSGFLVPVKDPETLADKVIYLLSNKGIRRKFGEINRKIIEERNDYYKEMSKVEKIYEQLAQGVKK